MIVIVWKANGFIVVCFFNNQHDTIDYLNDREERNNQYVLKNQLKIDIKHTIEQLLMDTRINNDDSSLYIIKEEHRKSVTNFKKKNLIINKVKRIAFSWKCTCW